jgi:hypothetical protein
MTLSWIRQLLRPKSSQARLLVPGRRRSHRPLLERLEERRLPSTFTVTNTLDSGAGSLRQAILDANAHTGTDTISFAIASGVQTIAPASPLPAITDAVVINGTSQPGFAGKPLVELNGTNAGSGANGLKITGGGSTVKGLAINRFASGAGILLTGLGGNTVTGNFLGTDSTGTLARPNQTGVLIQNSSNNTVGPNNVISGNLRTSGTELGIGVKILGSAAVAAAGNVIKGNKIGTDVNGTAQVGNNNGVVVQDANNNTIGGTTSAAGNLISGNGLGILIEGTVAGLATGNVVQGNRIGTNAAKTAALPNLTGVAIVVASGNTVGGTSAGAGNLISGNSGTAVSLSGISTLPATGNLVQGNKIGTNAAGTGKLANGGFGVALGKFTSLNTVGGTADGAGNLISGNGSDGVAFVDSTSARNAVQGNKIGTKADGVGALGNGGHGVFVKFGHDMLIGGAGAGNTIAFNALAGVAVLDPASFGNRITRNAIFSNGGLGIDLGDDGVTANDGLFDGDDGPNGLQNFPILNAASSTSTDITVAGSLFSSLFSTFVLEFFSSPAADPSGSGEGQTFVGALTVTTGLGGLAQFNVTFPKAVPQWQFITATATGVDSTNTSEFSVAKVIGPRLAVGSDTGDPPLVQVYDAPTGQLQYAFAPYPASFHGGVRVAVGDLNGDGVPDIVAAPGPGSALPVRVFDGDSGQPLPGPLGNFFPFGPAFDRGVFVAVGKFDADQADDLVISQDAGGRPRVKIFSGADGHVLADFLAFDQGFPGGVRLAVADVNGDGHDDIVAAAGPGGPPRVTVFDGTNPAHVLRSFLAYPTGFRGGVFAAAGDLDNDGKAEIVTGMGEGGRPLVKVFDGASGRETASFEAYHPDFRGGVRVAVVRDLNHDGGPEIVTGTGPGGGGEVQVFDGRTHDLLDDFGAADPLSSGGVFVAGRR